MRDALQWRFLTSTMGYVGYASEDEGECEMWRGSGIGRDVEGAVHTRWIASSEMRKKRRGKMATTHRLAKNTVLWGKG